MFNKLVSKLQDKSASALLIRDFLQKHFLGVCLARERKDGETWWNIHKLMCVVCICRYILFNMFSSVNSYQWHVSTAVAKLMMKRQKQLQQRL